MKPTVVRVALPAAMVIILLAAQCLTARPRQTSLKPLDRANSLAVFERIKKLEGTWHAVSTKGWTEVEQFRVIAKGSAVKYESVPGATQDENGPAPMLTVYYMDGDRLLLTHFCEARNQPRLVASSVENDGK